jgi:type IV pilus assembly protein PilM
MVITKKIIVPAGQKEEELELTVEAEANQYIPFALDEVNLDFQILGPASSSADEVEVLIAASRKEKVEDRVAAAEAAGLKPRIMDVESYATQETFQLIGPSLPANGRDQNIALVDIGSHVSHFYVLRNNQFLFSRDQAFGEKQRSQDLQPAIWPSDHLSHEASIADYHPRPGWHGCVFRQAQATQYSGFRQ